MKNTYQLNEKELSLGLIGKGSWHEEFKNSPYIYIGNLPLDITEQYIRSIFAQWGQIDDLDMVRDKESQRFKGFAFLSYKDIRSTIMAIDNFNSIYISTPTTTLAQQIRVDHVLNYEKKKEKPSYDYIIKKALDEVNTTATSSSSPTLDDESLKIEKETIQRNKTTTLREEKNERKKKRRELRGGR